MAFPTVHGTAFSEQTGNSTSHVVSIPDGSNVAGYLVVLVFSRDGTGLPNTFDVPFTIIREDRNQALLGIYYRVVDGTEGWDGTGDTITITTPNEESESAVIVFSNWHGATIPEVYQAGTKGTDAAADPPSLSPTWGAEDTTWIAVCTIDGDSTVTGYPTNYTGNQHAGSSGGTGGVAIGFATRNLNAATEDPGPFTNTSNPWATNVIAVRPPAAVSGNPPVNTTAPVVTGLPYVGETLTTTDGLWTEAPTFTYQWQRDDGTGGAFADITGETADTYVLTDSDVGFSLLCVVTGTNADGSADASSNQVGPVQAIPARLRDLAGNPASSFTTTVENLTVEVLVEGMRVEFSQDNLTVANVDAAWVDVTDFVQEAEWFSGVGNQLDDPQAGGAVIALKNEDRRFEPEYEGSPYYPNIDLYRRFRITVDGVTQGIYYLVDPAVEWYGKTKHNRVVMTCVDGMGLLGQARLDRLNPPDAEDFGDVVAYYEPFGAWPLGEEAGTKMVAHVRKVKRHGKVRRRRHKTLETREEVTGETGNPGVYKNLPTLGVEGCILGDPATAVEFRKADQTYATVPVDISNFKGPDRLSVVMLVRMTTTTGQHGLLRGPISDDGVNPLFTLFQQDDWFGGTIMQTLTQSGVGTGHAHTLGDIVVLGLTYADGRLRLYIDGEIDDEVFTAGTLANVAADPTIRIGHDGNVYGSFVGQWPAMFEKELEPASMLHLYEAARQRGFPEQTAGERIAAAADSTLWETGRIQASGLTVQPTMKHGQSPLEEIFAAARAEMPHAQFFFDGDGNPVYLGWEYKATGSYATPVATFGDDAAGAEVRLEDLAYRYDPDIFNIVTASRDGGAGITVTDDVSVAARGEHNYDATGLLLADDTDVRKVADALQSAFSVPLMRPTEVQLNGAGLVTQTHIVTREIGDLIRVRRRGPDEVPIDTVAHIVGWRKSYNAKERVLRCTWNMARGFNAASGYWRAGITGFSEAGSTTKAA